MFYNELVFFEEGWIIEMKIKYLIMDIDGSLTDGKVYMGNKGELMKAFSVKDGYSINFILKPEKIEPIVITARKSKIVEQRCKELGIREVYQGVLDKLSKLKEIIGNDSLGQCAYFGDDILDLPCMESIILAGGVVGCPCDAVAKVKKKASYVCKQKAGEGAFREFTEWVVSPSIDEIEIERRICFALNYIRSLNKKEVKKEKTYINEYFYLFTQEYYTNEMKGCFLESHKKYVDIQWIIEGEEEFKIADIEELNHEKEYLEESDVMLWKPKELMMRVVLRAGSYIVILPRNAYMVSGVNGENCNLKKIVGKVKISD